MSIRVALYYAPSPADPLWRAGCTWLGRDPETAAATKQPAIPGLPELTAAPAIYGFHATLKPPFRLLTSYAAMRDAVMDLAAETAPFDLPPLRIASISGFVALQDAAPSPALHALADRSVETLDPHRAPPNDAELARRRAGGRLTARQDAMLVRWGYPYVFKDWHFHMTLTRRLSPEERAAITPAAETHFTAALAMPRRVDTVTIFTQAAAGAPFLAAERIPLSG